jgi:hypothetical protein
MPQSKVTWNGPKFMSLLKAEMKRRIFACVIQVQKHAKKLIGIEGAANTTKKRGQKLKVGAMRSKPGEPPRAQTKRLQNSVASEVGGQGGNPAGRAGTNVKYGRTLELGAEDTRDTVFGKKVKPFRWVLLTRPWLRRALDESLDFIKAVMKAPMKF